MLLIARFPVKKFLAPIVLIALIFSVFPFGPTVTSASASTGALIVTTEGTPDTSPTSNWSYDSSTGVLNVTGTASIAPSYLQDRLAERNLIIQASTITINSSIVTTAANRSVTFRATSSIRVAEGLSISTNGGNITFQSRFADGSVGAVILGDRTTNSVVGSVTSNGGNIILSGGSDPLTGFARADNNWSVTGNSTFKPAIGLYGYTLNASGVSQGGNIILRGETDLNSAGDNPRGVELADSSSFTTSVITSGEGDITIHGKNPTVSITDSQFAFGIALWSAQITTQNGDISLFGEGRTTVPTQDRSRSVQLAGNLTRSVVGEGGTSLTSTAGNIFITDETASNRVAYAPYFATTTLETGGSVIVESDWWQVPNNPSNSLILKTPSATFQSRSTSWNRTIFLRNINATQAGSLTVGRTTNTTAIQIPVAYNVSGVFLANPVTAAGPVTLNGGIIEIFSPLTSSGQNSLISLNGTSVTQSAAITTENLSLNKVGTYTLTNASNQIGRVAAGSSSTKLTSLSLFDASGGLIVGQVGSLEGITATGTVLIETGAGDITLSKNIATDSTSASAITVNAGKSTAAGTGTGGDILVSGSPTVTAGTGATVRMFSGSEAASTGLTTLVGGSANVRYGVDESSDFSSDPLVSGRSYALYRSLVQSPPVVVSPPVVTPPVVATPPVVSSPSVSGNTLPTSGTDSVENSDGSQSELPPVEAEEPVVTEAEEKTENEGTASDKSNPASENQATPVSSDTVGDIIGWLVAFVFVGAVVAAVVIVLRRKA